MNLLLAALFAVVSAEAASARSVPHTVQTTSGRVTGTFHADTNVIEFAGVPFAEPPTGPLRWKSPRVLTDRWDDEVNATGWKDSMACTQIRHGDVFGSEDCLYLTVIVPATQGESLLPVWQHVYGGSFTSGYAGRPEYSGRRLVEHGKGSFVWVAANYRVGAFGFCAVPGLADEHDDFSSGGTGGLLGLEDQRAAMQWVQLNIAAFGGDPNRVTVSGQSAGAISVSAHVASPLSAGLFSAVILESGASDGPTIAPREAGEAQGKLFADATPCTTLACLRGLSTADTMRYARDLGGYEGFTSHSFGASLDGANLPAMPSEILRRGQQNRVPMLLGSNSDEFGVFVALNEAWQQQTASSFLSDLRSLVAQNGGSEADQDEAASFYDPARYGGDVRRANTAARSHAVFICGMRRAARYAEGGPPAFLYSFRHRPEHGSLAGPADAYTGAFHQAELVMLFDNYPVDGNLITSLAPAEKELADNMRRMWTRFVAGHNPNSHAAVFPSGGVPTNWEPYDPSRDNYVRLQTGDGLGMLEGDYVPDDACALWDRLADFPADDHKSSGSGGGDSSGAASTVALLLAMLALAAAAGALLISAKAAKRAAAAAPAADAEYTLMT